MNEVNKIGRISKIHPIFPFKPFSFSIHKMQKLSKSQNMILLNGKKIKLRDWQQKDLSSFRFWNTEKHLWMDFNGPYYPKLTPEQLEETIEKYQDKIDRNAWETPREKLVIVDTEKDEMLGLVNWYWQSKETNWLSIGIVIYDEKKWRGGIGYEALVLWMDYLFSQNKDLVRLDLRTWSGNERMIKLGEKLGFIIEARFRKARIINGEYFDSIGMGILREEWNSSKHTTI